MEIIAEYSFNKGKEFIEKSHKAEFQEIKKVARAYDGLHFALQTRRKYVFLGI
jgi:hypothetical protein